ncbi:mercury resistance system periplasmic binding protein MerP [Aromatoleum evansii]|uniref:mercury resistance system periplasmic binding protein MerP n=1 Tax=Aromatoleum evansii TaxID=59406 RepID=UPI00248342A0|nr:mercury resistance system periplasmic binding protein MerP [Aromatoleum evansii]
MKVRTSLLALAWMAAMLTAPVWAAPRTVTLSVPTMDCPVCPITVKKALSKVAGVAEVTVDFDKHEATVSFDDVKTNVEALTRATRDAGYPSTLAGSMK